MDESVEKSTPIAPSPLPAELLGSLSSLLGGAQAEKKGGTPSSSPPSDGIGALLSNPELLSRLPSMISLLRPVLEGATSQVSEKDTAKTEIAAAQAKPVLSVPEEKGRERQRNELLLALKPFLSKERCEAVDMILRLGALGSVLRHIH